MAGKKYPILIIIPHGGYAVPEELSGYEDLGRFDIFFESDACANDLFALDDMVLARIDSRVSRLFVDLDRPMRPGKALTPNGVIRSETLTGRKVFRDGVSPDEIAIANILKRYYLPFHQAIEKIVRTRDIRLILECHTMMAVGPKHSPDPGRPRPIVSLQHRVGKDDGEITTCRQELAAAFLDGFGRAFADEDVTVAERFSLNHPYADGHIMKKYGDGDIPLLRLSVSKALFLNDRYFNHDYLRVDELRIRELKAKIASVVDRFAAKYL